MVSIRSNRISSLAFFFCFIHWLLAEDQLRALMLRNGMLRKIDYYFGISHKNDFALLNFEKRNVKTDIF